jgi:hypothetical protein
VKFSGPNIRRGGVVLSLLDRVSLRAFAGMILSPPNVTTATISCAIASASIPSALAKRPLAQSTIGLGRY